MSRLSTFSDFLAATRVTRIAPPDEILAEAVERTYLLQHMVKGTEPARSVRTGASVKDDIMLTDTGTFEFYNPNATFSPVDQDNTTDIEADWRFATVHQGFNDETITLNEGNTEDVFFNLKKKYDQNMVIDTWNGMERALHAPPTVEMETGAGQRPPTHSIHAFVNGRANTLPAGFSTILGVDPVTEDRWRNQIERYDASNPADPGVGLIHAFDEMFLSVKFEAPESSGQYFNSDRLQKMKIITNRDGRTLWQRLMRGGNDRFPSPQDPAYNDAQYSGIPVTYMSRLDEELLDTTNGTAWAEGFPAFYWLNLEFLYPIWHSARYMEQVGPISGGIRQPFSHAVYKRSYYIMWCRSRQRQGFVQPQGVAY